MIITQTPFRMSFFGGGTDIQDYFQRNGGAVISTTIDKYCYVTVRRLPGFFDFKTHLTYSEMEYVNNNEEIRHPLIRNAMEMLDMQEIRLTYDADLPARSGLGTSSSFAVGMLKAFYALNGQYAGKKQLAEEAIYLERVLCNEAGGWQDQIAASYGGLNRIDFDENGFTVRPIVMSKKRKEQFNDNLLLFFTGFTRFSADIQKENNIVDKNKQLKEMLNLVNKAERILTSEDEDLKQIGQLLNETWLLKKQTGKEISTNDIDVLYEKAISAGAVGGKLLGAGGGGFLLFYVEKDKQKDVIEALNNLLLVPFKFECEGSQIIYYVPEDR